MRGVEGDVDAEVGVVGDWVTRQNHECAVQEKNTKGNDDQLTTKLFYAVYERRSKLCTDVLVDLVFL